MPFQIASLWWWDYHSSVNILNPCIVLSSHCFPFLNFLLTFQVAHLRCVGNNLTFFLFFLSYIIRIGWIKIIKGKYPLTEYVVNTSFYCIILRLSFANSISNVLSNHTTLMVPSHLGVFHPKFVYCLVLPLFFFLSLLTITRGTLTVWLATTWHFFCSTVYCYQNFR